MNGNIINNLCAGDYTITLTNGIGCTFTKTYTIPCPTSTSCPSSNSLCVQITPTPTAAITSVPAPDNLGNIEICQGQEVFFENTSLNADTYVWYFGDGQNSTQQSPSHVYDQPGSYSVSLVARTSCFCADTALLTVNVLAVDPPTIDCIGSVCEGENVTYNAPPGCSSYTWAVSPNANITGGGGPSDDFITVDWTTGPEGWISLQTNGCNASSATCSVPTVIPIAIMSDNAKIIGPDKVCDGQVAEYSIPDFLGANIVWEVTEAATIKSGQGTNRLTVEWASGQPNPQHVSVFFENCFLGCSGRDTLLVNLRPNFFIEGNIQFCQGDIGLFTARNSLTQAPVTANWQVLNENGVAVWTSPAAVPLASVDFNFAGGNYTLRAVPASPNSYCNDFYEIGLTVFSLPPPVGVIDGEEQICPNQPYSYTAVGLGSAGVEWTILDGSNTYHLEGNPVNIAWGNVTPRILTVQQISTDGLLCTSDPTSVAITLLQQPTITGPLTACLDTKSNFNASNFGDIDYQWVVTPTDAGTIVGGQGTSSVEIEWHSVGQATLSVQTCSGLANFAVNILPKPSPQVADQATCPGGAVQVSTSMPYGSYVWKNAAGASVSTLPSPNLGPGFYQVIVTDAEGCVGNGIFEISAYPLPTVNLTSPIYLGICPGGPGADLIATSQVGGLSYEWTGPSGPLAYTGSSLHTNEPGTYIVEVTSPDGCPGVASYSLQDCESLGGTCVNGICTVPIAPCPLDGDISFEILPTADCATHIYQNTSTNAIPGSFLWQFASAGSIVSNNPTTVTYGEPGYYGVFLGGFVKHATDPNGQCPDGELLQDSILAAAKFEATTACPGLPTQFKDKSKFLPSVSLTGWQWDFGEASSGACNTSNLQNPSHVYANPGNYQVKLTVTVNNGCQTSFTKNINILGLPTALIDAPASLCQTTPVAFSSNSSTGAVNFHWNFDDPASGDANQSTAPAPTHQFSDDGNYDVTLTLTNIYGCSASVSMSVSLQPNNLTGQITPAAPTPICPGGSVTLTASANKPVNYLWSNGTAAASLTTSLSGIYSVKLTDINGCMLTLPPVAVDVFGPPTAIVQAVEFNEFGQASAIFTNNYTVCEGDDVNLQVLGQLGYTYQWSTGSADSTLVFSEDKDNLLAAGTHDFSVMVTDGSTGCTSSAGITVTVNPAPAVEIASNPASGICEDTPVEMSVVSPQAGVNYAWATGEIGTSIDVLGAGVYFATSTNAQGCTARSNEIEILNAPGKNKVPLGCLTRCLPTEICLPDLPNVVSYQWLLNGDAVPPPLGNEATPQLTESGDYQVVMTDVNGCTSLSGVLSLELYQGYGTIGGTVYFDVNNNGVVDAADTTVSGIDFILLENGSPMGNLSSNLSGVFSFANIPSTAYTIQLDSTALPLGWTALVASQNGELVGCDDELQTEWLLQFQCQNSAASLELSACAGESANYNGNDIAAGSSEVFIYANAQGCDSVLTVTVAELPTSSGSLTLTVCPGGTVIYQGTTLQVGDNQDFTWKNWLGCDSVVTVTVAELPTSSASLTLTACSGGTVIYQGTTLQVGDNQDFTWQNWLGCDSVVTVTVAELPTSSGSLTLTACPGGTVIYQGTTLQVGDNQSFTWQNWQGCDSVVMVNVVLSSVIDTTVVERFLCPGETSLEYNGMSFSAGDEHVFVLSGQGLGDCDSIVLLKVIQSPEVDFWATTTPICANSQVGKIEFFDQAGPSAPYQYSVDGGLNFSEEKIHAGLSAGHFELRLKDAVGCVFEDEIDIEAYPPLQVETQNVQADCADRADLHFQVENHPLPYTWHWASDDGTEISIDSVFVATQTGTYYLLAKNECETLVRAVSVSLENGPAPADIYIPNSFSPNDDGINDCFRGYASPDLQLLEYHLLVFDRWGDHVFETDEIEGCWDGIFRGQKMDPAVLVWHIIAKAVGCDGKPLDIFREGGVTIMR